MSQIQSTNILELLISIQAACQSLFVGMEFKSFQQSTTIWQKSFFQFSFEEGEKKKLSAQNEMIKK